MSENNKSIVEEALLSMKNLEDIISENAKGILASTMKEEIGELVRESLSGSKKRNLREQENAQNQPEDADVDSDEESDEFDYEEEDVEDTDVPDETETVTDLGTMDVDKQELPPLDMTQAPMSDVIKVFRAMGDEDGIVVTKDEKGLHLKDNEKEYLIVMDDENTPKNMNESKYFDRNEFTEDFDYEDSEGDPFSAFANDVVPGLDEDSEFDFSEYEDEDEEDIDLGMEYDELGEDSTFHFSDYEDEDDDYSGDVHRKWYDKNIKNDEIEFDIDQEALESVLESFKYSKKPNMEGGFDDDVKEGPKRHGKGGSAKKTASSFYPKKMRNGVSEINDEEYESEWTEDSDEDLVYREKDYKETETKEAARTLGNGRKWGRKGLPKPRTAPRHIAVESVQQEVNLLRERNEEYKKALDFFRNKLNEVAVFNSNLAYSTRLFTEHSTTKQEKINILRRFDDVDTLKESKNLYKTIKNELDGKGTSNVVKESITERVIKTPQTGSATNLIENKTYENPQFVRMKDLMAKIK